MKTKEENQEKEFDTVKFFRAVKERISEETQGMSFKEFKVCFTLSFSSSMFNFCSAKFS